MTKTYIEIYYPGSFFPETSVKEVKDRTLIPIPKGAFAYSFFDVKEQKVGNEVLKGSPKNKSGRYYAGEKLSLENVKAKYPEKDTLIFNMEANGWEFIVKTTMGNF